MGSATGGSLAEPRRIVPAGDMALIMTPQHGCNVFATEPTAHGDMRSALAVSNIAITTEEDRWFQPANLP